MKIGKRNDQKVISCFLKVKPLTHTNGHFIYRCHWWSILQRWLPLYEWKEIQPKPGYLCPLFVWASPLLMQRQESGCERAPRCLFIKEEINSPVKSPPTWIQSVAGLKSVITKHLWPRWKGTRQADVPPAERSRAGLDAREALPLLSGIPGEDLGSRERGNGRWYLTALCEHIAGASEELQKTNVTQQKKQTSIRDSAPLDDYEMDGWQSPQTLK